jgi:hypothetical protein
VTGPLAQRRHWRRRRITPNPTTTTTTIISTHNHPGMAASFVGAGAEQADATAGSPGKQLARVQAASRVGIDGRAARARGDRGAPPADLGWPGGCQTAAALLRRKAKP